MDAAQFRQALADLRLSQVELARELSQHSEKPVSAVTVWRYAEGRSTVPAGVAAYLALRLKHSRRPRR